MVHFSTLSNDYFSCVHRRAYNEVMRLNYSKFFIIFVLAVGFFLLPSRIFAQAVGANLPKQPVGCVQVGCNGEVCTDAGRASSIITTCEAKPVYQCYEGAACERQANGQCGFTLSPEAKACVASYGGTSNETTPPTENSANPTHPTEVPPATACTPRPSCLDSYPKCTIAEPAGGWCPSSVTFNPADINRDGKVNLLDYSLLAGQFLKQGKYQSADINRDGRVDLADYSLLVRAFQP